MYISISFYISVYQQFADFQFFGRLWIGRTGPHAVAKHVLKACLVKSKLSRTLWSTQPVQMVIVYIFFYTYIWSLSLCLSLCIYIYTYIQVYIMYMNVMYLRMGWDGMGFNEFQCNAMQGTHAAVRIVLWPQNHCCWLMSSSHTTFLGNHWIPRCPGHAFLHWWVEITCRCAELLCSGNGQISRNRSRCQRCSVGLLTKQVL